MSHTPFDPSRFTAPKAKPLPVVLLLDVSGSMGGEKIRHLNDAVRDMLDVFRDTETSESEISVAIITFGAQVTLHQPLASAGDVEWHDLSAQGATPLGVALQMAKAMFEDKDVVPSRAYRPTVVLVSDGQPDSGWEEPLRAFVSDGRSAKCDRMAMAIGADADEAVLGKFIAGTTNKLFYAENARQLREFFKFVTMSVTIRTKSQTPNVVPDASVIDVKPATIDERSQTSPAATDNASDDDGGYW
jgi:uncharacterized protein YegL